MSAVLGIGGFDLARALEYKPTFLEPEYPFEWAGMYELSAGDYTMTVNDGPDPFLKIGVCEALPRADLDPVKTAERVFALFSDNTDPVSAGEVIEPGVRSRLLDLPPR